MTPREKDEIDSLLPAISSPARPGGDWREWLNRLFPAYVSAPFAERHIELWDWLDAIMPGTRPAPFVAIWPRGGAKSTTAELGAVRMGARRARRYIWYVSSTQDKADKHVETVASMLESKAVERADADLSNRKTGKYGNSKGWRRERLRTASGLTVDALGLDSGARGAKVEEQRPDMIILDDVDEKEDTPKTTQRKIDLITTSILPAGSDDCAVLFIQNLIHPDSIASRLADGRADFIADRIVSGPYPAVEGLAYEQNADGKFIITAGQATWEGQSLAVCQDQITTWGLTSFRKEAQHEVDESGGVWDHINFRYCEWGDVPWSKVLRSAVWVDPAVTDTDESDSMGIQADAVSTDKKLYRLFSWEGITSPEDAIKRAILKGIEIKADHVGVETDQGGDTWKSVYKIVCQTIQKESDDRWQFAREQRAKNGEKIDPNEKPPVIIFPKFASDKAGAGYGSKVERNQRMLTDYEGGRVIHVIGTHTALERSLKRFPRKPLDLADAAFWGWNDLLSPKGVFLG